MTTQNALNQANVTAFMDAKLHAVEVNRTVLSLIDWVHRYYLEKKRSNRSNSNNTCSKHAH